MIDFVTNDTENPFFNGEQRIKFQKGLGICKTKDVVTDAKMFEMLFELFEKCQALPEYKHLCKSFSEQHAVKDALVNCKIRIMQRHIDDKAKTLLNNWFVINVKVGIADNVN